MRFQQTSDPDLHANAVQCGNRRPPKHLILALAAASILVSLASQPAGAYLCTGGSLDVWPPSGDVPRNPVFVVQGTVKWSSEVARLTDGWAYLESEAGRTDLVEVRRFEPQALQITQVVYQPAEPLQPGRTYWMVVKRDPSIEYGPVRPRNRWRIKAQADDKRPWFSSPPEAVLIRGHGLGGRTTMSIWFRFEATEEPVLVLADIGPNSEYYRDRRRLLLFPRERRFSFHSGPCGRNFLPRAGGSYLVNFKLMDAAGNVAGSPAHRVTFEVPDANRGERRPPGPGF